MPNSDSVIDRLKNYCYDQKNTGIVKSGIIKGINPADSTVVIEKDGISKNITIDTLESNTWYSIDANNNIVLTDTNITQNEIATPAPVEELEVMEEVLDEPEENTEVIETINTEVQTVSNLKQMQDAIANKDEQTVNKALETFAIDDKTGAININKAIKIVTDNCTNNVVECVKNGLTLSDDLSAYDITGRPLTPFTQGASDVQTLVDKSFNAILVYVEAAKLKNIVYNDAQIGAAKTKYLTGVNDRLNVLGLSNKPLAPVETETTDSTDSAVSDIKPDTDINKAGFADVLILTVIVLIYAAIIVNLVSKLK